MHDEYADRTKRYLLAKTLELTGNGIDVILDWGFWRKADRDAIRAHFAAREIASEFHYIDIDDDTWHARLKKRNRAVENGKADAYYVDENLAGKFLSRFEKPVQEEMDCWICR